MNIIIPMAGLGQRFVQAGFNIPKPLIPIGNIPMYQAAVNGLPLHLATKLIFIIRENAFTPVLKKNIHGHYKDKIDYYIVTLRKHTRGQAETVSKASAWIDKNEPTLVHNCDTHIETEIDWTICSKQNIDGGLVLFPSQEPRWSYAKLNSSRTQVIDIQEKKVISSYASTGTYYFIDTPYLLFNINYMITNQRKENNEYYLSTVYRLMLQEKKKIVPFWAKNIDCYGTPVDLLNTLNNMVVGFKKRSNS